MRIISILFYKYTIANKMFKQLVPNNQETEHTFYISIMRSMHHKSGKEFTQNIKKEKEKNM